MYPEKFVYRSTFLMLVFVFVSIFGCVSGDTEHMINARVDFYCRMRGAQYLAYPPVVAAGNNANIIHYINNTQETKMGDLVLMDAGCEYGGYCSDITRTWPTNGTFTKSQEILYEIVHLTQRGIYLAAENAKIFSLDDLFDLMCSHLGKYLQDIVKPDKLSEMGSPRQIGFRFCPHHVSHYLGMDIHDTPLIKRSRPVVPGMIFTIEPGMHNDDVLPAIGNYYYLNNMFHSLFLSRCIYSSRLQGSL